MKKAIVIILGILVIAVLGLLALIHIPSPKFEPVAYEPIRPDYWPTEGFQTSTPEEQGMDSGKLVEMVEFYQEDHAKNPTNSIDTMFALLHHSPILDADERGLTRISWRMFTNICFYPRFPR